MVTIVFDFGYNVSSGEGFTFFSPDKSCICLSMNSILVSSDWRIVDQTLGFKSVWTLGKVCLALTSLGFRNWVFFGWHPKKLVFFSQLQSLPWLSMITQDWFGSQIWFMAHNYMYYQFSCKSSWQQWVPTMALK